MAISNEKKMIASGKAKIDWVWRFMPVLHEVEKILINEGTFAGKTIAMSIHMEAKTANLALMLARAGANVYATGCNPLSTQDDVAKALAAEGVTVHARYGCSAEEYEQDLMDTLKCMPDLFIDDGGDLVSLLHGKAHPFSVNVIGGCEETTTGISRLVARAEKGKLEFPMLAVNNAACKHLFDNHHGTGQSVWDGIMRGTNVLIAGKVVVVAGYGDCGSGVAKRARGLGARVVVCEVDAVKAISAVSDGFTVMPMSEAAEIGDIFVTVTGCKDVLTKEHFDRMKSGAMLSNAGHFNVEINLDDLALGAEEIRESRENIHTYTYKNGKVLHLLGVGRLVNLVLGDGHPAEIMDLSFAVQALALKHLAETGRDLAPDLYRVPEDVDERISEIKLRSMGMRIDTLTREQKKYLSSF